jgi:hypothetical protein
MPESRFRDPENGSHGAVLAYKLLSRRIISL